MAEADTNQLVASASEEQPKLSLKERLSSLKKLPHHFGWQFLVQLFSAYMGVKGMLYACVSLAQLPYYKSLNVSGQRYQKYRTVALTPWALKALIGTVSDALPIFGYHKRYYILIAGFLGTFSFLLLGATTVTPTVAALLFLLSNVEPAVVDLLCEGKYAELMVAKPETGSDLVTFVWACYFIGGLVASIFVGVVSDNSDDPSVLFFGALPFAAQILIPTALGYLPEQRKPTSGCQWQVLKNNWNVFLLALCMAMGSVALSATNLYGSDEAILACSLVTSVILCGMAFLLLPTTLAKCNLYMFCADVLYVNIPGPLEYFYTAEPDCIESGPHFQYTYYITYSSIVQSVFGVIGVLTFQAVMREWHFRSVFWVSILLKMAASIVDIVIVNRWNIAVGISDKVMYMLGNNIIYQVTSMVAFMPAVVLTSKLCPKGMEATVYALLAGFQNFGFAISSSIGSYLVGIVGIQTTVPCDFSNLSKLIFLCHFILPLFALPLTFVLLPNAKLTDNLTVAPTARQQVKPVHSDGDSTTP